jgi:hypothetical protein
MQMYNIEFLRRGPVGKEPELVEIVNMMAFDPRGVIEHAGLLLRTVTFRATLDAFRIRENGRDIVFQSDFTLVTR